MAEVPAPTAPVYPPTPTLDRMKEVRPQTEAVADFYEWLHANGFAVMKVISKPGIFTDSEFVEYVHPGGLEPMLADWQEIDLAAADREKRALLDYVREAQGLNAAGA